MVALFKVCGKCKEEQFLLLFPKNRTKPDGFHNWCKECCRKHSAERREQHSEHVREINRKSRKKNWAKVYARNKEWVKKNPERWAEIQKESYLKHAEARRKHSLEWHKNNPVSKEVHRERKRKWMENNRDKHCAIQNSRRAAKIKATPKWANAEKISLFYKRAKILTEQTGVEHQVDHIVPLKNEIVCGLHVEFNLQILTKSENSRKNNLFDPSQGIAV